MAIAEEQRESLKRSTNEENNPNLQLPTAEVSSLLSHFHSLTSIAARHSNPSMQVERIMIRARRLAGNQEAFSQCVNTLRTYNCSDAYRSIDGSCNNKDIPLEVHLTLHSVACFLQNMRMGLMSQLVLIKLVMVTHLLDHGLVLEQSPET